MRVVKIKERVTVVSVMCGLDCCKYMKAYERA